MISYWFRPYHSGTNYSSQHFANFLRHWRCSCGCTVQLVASGSALHNVILVSASLNGNCSESLLNVHRYDDMYVSSIDVVGWWLCLQSKVYRVQHCLTPLLKFRLWLLRIVTLWPHFQHPSLIDCIVQYRVAFNQRLYFVLWFMVLCLWSL